MKMDKNDEGKRNTRLEYPEEYKTPTDHLIDAVNTQEKIREIFDILKHANIDKDNTEGALLHFVIKDFENLHISKSIGKLKRLYDDILQFNLEKTTYRYKKFRDKNALYYENKIEELIQVNKNLRDAMEQMEIQRITKEPKETMSEKRCTKCGEVKPLSEFGKHRNSPDGHAWQCIECTRKQQREGKYKKIKVISHTPNINEVELIIEKEQWDELEKADLGGIPVRHMNRIRGKNIMFISGVGIKKNVLKHVSERMKLGRSHVEKILRLYYPKIKASSINSYYLAYMKFIKSFYTKKPLSTDEGIISKPEQKQKATSVKTWVKDDTVLIDKHRATIKGTEEDILNHKNASIHSKYLEATDKREERILITSPITSPKIDINGIPFDSVRIYEILEEIYNTKFLIKNRKEILDSKRGKVYRLTISQKPEPDRKSVLVIYGNDDIVYLLAPLTKETIVSDVPNKKMRAIEEKYHTRIEMKRYAELLRFLAVSPRSKLKDISKKLQNSKNNTKALIRFGEEEKCIKKYKGKSIYSLTNRGIKRMEKLVQKFPEDTKIKEEWKTSEGTYVLDKDGIDVHAKYGTPVIEERYKKTKNVLNNIWSGKGSIDAINNSLNYTKNSIKAQIMYGQRKDEIKLVGKNRDGEMEYCLASKYKDVTKPKTEAKGSRMY